MTLHRVPPPLTEPAPRVLSPGTFWIRDTMNAGSVGCGSWQRPVNGPSMEEAEKAEAGLWRVLEAMGGDLGFVPHTRGAYGNLNKDHHTALRSG